MTPLGVGALACVGVVLAGIRTPDFLAGTGLALEQVELSIEISSEGQVSILGTGGKLEGKGGIKLSFKRVAAT